MGTDFLYARPSFWGGMAEAIDLCGVLVSEYNRSNTPNIADYRALSSDWAITGMDISKATEQFKTIANVKAQ